MSEENILITDLSNILAHTISDNSPTPHDAIRVIAWAMDVDYDSIRKRYAHYLCPRQNHKTGSAIFFDSATFAHLTKPFEKGRFKGRGCRFSNEILNSFMNEAVEIHHAIRSATLLQQEQDDLMDDDSEEINMKIIEKLARDSMYAIVGGRPESALKYIVQIRQLAEGYNR